MIQVLEPAMTFEALADDRPEVVFRLLRDDGTVDPETDPGLSVADLLEGYRQMRRIRLLDTRMVTLQRQGRVSFYGGARGQEAVPVAAALASDKDDWVFPALREHGVMLARGYPLASIVAQVFGNAGDPAKGRQMPCHASSRSVAQVSWSSCVGSQIPHAVGAAWAMRARRSASVAIAFLGDGATSEGDFHAAMNFAGVWKVPCVLICQNNQWSISVPVDQQTSSPTLALKARGYGVPSLRVDGNDLLALVVALRRAIGRARGGGGPTFLEAVTCRIGAHSTSDDPSRYQSPDQLAEWARKDPIDRLRFHLLRVGAFDAAAEAAMDAELTDELSAAIEAVESLPPPPIESLFEDVYGDLPWHLREQLAELKKSKGAPTGDP